ncbi:MAG: SDR family NAD(P)-dependent oxidoreductase [Mycobacterium sp.]
MDLKDKTAIVTGGGSGLGRATALRLADGGARVAVWDANAEAAAATANAIGGLALTVDVTSAEQAESALDRVVDEFGAVHLAVACAGIAPAAKVVSRGVAASLDGFRRTIEVNLVGTFNVVRVAVAAMLDNPGGERSDGGNPGGERSDGGNPGGERGVVVLTASGAAYDGQVGQSGYSASKAGVIGMLLPLARDLAGKGIRVNAIAPGMFGTAMVAGMTDKVQDSLLEMILEPRRMGAPDEFAALVEHIVANPYLNAECIRLDAGMRMTPR